MVNFNVSICCFYAGMVNFNVSICYHVTVLTSDLSCKPNLPLVSSPGGRHMWAGHETNLLYTCNTSCDFGSTHVAIFWLLSRTLVESAMSLFQYGVRRLSKSQVQNDQEITAPSHIPTLAELGLGRVEFKMTLASGIGELADPAPSAAKKRKMRGNYARYTPEQRASIGKYALENGNERTRCHFFIHFPQLK